MSEPKYRVWKAYFPDLKTYRISLKPAKTEAEIRELFSIPDHVKVEPILDMRMKNGGKQRVK